MLAKTDSFQQYTDLPHESMLIMQYVDEHQRITLKEAEQLTSKVSKSTLKNRLAQLVKQGLLVRHGKARGTWYSKPG